MTGRTFPLRELLAQADTGIWVADEDLDDGVSILRSTNFTDEGIIDFTNLAYKGVPHEERLRKALIPGDILLERSGGGPNKPVGRVVIFSGHASQHVFGNFVSRLRTKNGVEPHYLFWYLFNFHATGRTSYLQKQTTGIRNLEYRRYLEQSIPLPPLDEQRRIVDLLERAAGIRRLREQALAKARAIVPALFFDMFGDPASNPKGWPIVPFGSSVENLDRSRVPLKSADRSKRPGRFPYYGASGIIDYIDDFIFSDRLLLIAEDGANLVLKSTPIAFIAEGRYWVNNHAHIVRPIPPFTMEFLECFINTLAIKPFLSGSAQPKLNQENMNRIPLPKPDKVIQQMFSDRLADLRSIIAQQERSLAAARELERSLMARLLG